VDKSSQQCLRIRSVPITVKRGEGKKWGKKKINRRKRRNKRSPGKAVVLDKGRHE